MLVTLLDVLISVLLSIHLYAAPRNAHMIQIISTPKQDHVQNCGGRHGGQCHVYLLID